MSRVIERKTLTNYGAANVARMTASCLSQLRARWQGGRPREENILYDRRLASQISHDRCSITIEQSVEKKSRAPIHFPRPTSSASLCTFASQPCYRSTLFLGRTKKIYKQSLQFHNGSGARGAGNNESDPFWREIRRFVAPISPSSSLLTNGPTNTPDDERIIRVSYGHHAITLHANSYSSISQKVNK